jgi:exodeoxyribonuclease V alpha subunit
MVLANSPRAGIYNGDLGVVCRGAGATPEVCFAGDDGEVRRLPPGRVGGHETAFAITVHKSQGSEFDEVTVVLPGRPSPVLTRELLYTAITRARSRVEIVGSAEIVAGAIGTPTVRFSGLADRLKASLTPARRTTNPETAGR